MLKLIKDPNAHSHCEVFDTEDQAFAFIEGLYVGSQVPRVLVDTNGNPFPLHFYDGEDAEAFTAGVRHGQIHFGRIDMESIEFDCGIAPGYQVHFDVRAETKS